MVRGTGRSRGGALPTMEARTKGDAVSEASSEYSTVVEDILKLVWSAEEAGRDGVKPKDIGEHMGVVPSTTTENVQRLVRQGLVTHERYGRVRLTGQGRAVALGPGLPDARSAWGSDPARGRLERRGSRRAPQYARGGGWGRGGSAARS